MSDLNAAPEPIHRHRTAIVRHDLSQPVGLLARHGLIKAGATVFDYGCGQGDDLRILRAAGIEAEGWDPHFLPSASRIPAKVVNLGFVLNVIEDPEERSDALRAAWNLTEKVLAVATMIVGQVPTGGLRPHRDGFLTSRGTFQKYFQHPELRALIAQITKATPVAVAPGIFFVFRAPEDEQEFLLNKRAGRRASTSTYRAPREPRAPRIRRAARPTLGERIPTAVAEIAALIRRRGRPPLADEMGPAALEELEREHVSLGRATQVSLDQALTSEELEAAAAARREDLLVHYALALLNRSTSANRPSPAMVRDVRAHFGSQRELQLQANLYLHALAQEARVQEAMAKAVGDGLGVLDHRGRLLVDSDRADDLPGVLRCYFGCATLLSGEPDGRYVLRIDSVRRRVTMWPLIDPKAAFPSIEISVRVDLRRQDVNIRPDPRKLLRKSELFGMAAKSKQRRSETAYCAQQDLPPDTMFERLTPSSPDPPMH